MSYWKAKADLEYMRRFKDDVRRLFDMEDTAVEWLPPILRFEIINSERQKALQRIALKKVGGYEELRERVAKGVLKAVRLSRKLGCRFEIESIPPRNVGGVIIPQNIFQAITSDNSYGGIERQIIFDAINQTIDLCEDVKKEKWNHLINPLYWIKAVFLFVLRLPVNLIRLSGFNVDKFEEHFWGKFIQLLWMIGLLGILLAFGIARGDIIELIKMTITKQ